MVVRGSEKLKARVGRSRGGRPKGSLNKRTLEQIAGRADVKIRERYDSPWDEFREHVRKIALEGDSPAGLKGIYRDMLKLDSQMKRSWEIGADEIARRNLVAERELVEGGWIEGEVVE